MKIAALALLCSLSQVAAADDRVVTLDRTCVEIDVDKDGLGEADRARARELMQRVLERADQLVVTTGCTETYVLSHERADTGYVIRLRSAAGKRRMKTDALVDLGVKYMRMAHSLIEAKTMAALEPAAAPAPTVAAQPAVAALLAQPSEYSVGAATDAEEPPSVDNELPKRTLWYSTIGAQLTGGVAWSAGYRKHVDNVIVDVAVGVRGASSDRSGSSGSSFGGKLFGWKMISDHGELYAGGGLSVQQMERGDEYSANHSYYYGAGVHGDLAVGIQVGRAKGVQFLGQLDVTLPFYRLGNDYGDKDYVAAAALTGGLGW